MARPLPMTAPSAAEIPEAIAYLVYELVRLWGAHSEKRAKEFGLTSQQAALLLNLSREQPSMRELAERIGCDASNITGLVTRLEGRGLVRRVPDDADARVKRVHLSPGGEELTSRLRSRFFEGAPSVAGLPLSDQRALFALLRRAVDLRT